MRRSRAAPTGVLVVDVWLAVLIDLRGCMPLAPLLKRLTDVAIIMAVIAGVAFVIIASGNSLVGKTTLARSYGMWVGFITRPDIVVTSILAIIVTMAVSHYHGGTRR